MESIADEVRKIYMDYPVSFNEVLEIAKNIYKGELANGNKSK